MKSIFNIVSFFTAMAVSAQSTAVISEMDKYVKPRYRVIVDNDFGGDPDGLFQLVHQILSPSTEIRGIIGSHLKPGDPFDSSKITAENAVKKVSETLDVMNLKNQFKVFQGSNDQLKDLKTPNISEGAKAIVAEAMKADEKNPLFIVCGAGLTEVASAYLMEPKIADKIVVVWIGGPEYSDLATPPPGYTPLEYNLGIDIKAAQVVFNQSNLNIWQVPRNTYRQTLMSYAELLSKVKPEGKTGAYLTQKIEDLMLKTQKFNLLVGETYIMGDSPLVLLTALQSSFEADPSSSSYVLKNAPKINDNGAYEYNSNGRNIRVYTHLDTRLMFEDFYVKLKMFNSKK
ncbi:MULTISPECIES: nucleoside hydrolase [unclassified Chryseobacterium]|uniref:nucleoside hydrolase n=1 Tax=unclassified Chryseobacterium TaxID=2593645 RepID=UPI00226A8D4D|nr:MULTISPECIES: nucleoside hydrolase [unclassified Chryseobacterium]